jgi:O-antigen/teichoic acid export membrane protein
MDSRYSPQFPAGAWGFAAMAATISLLDAASTWADRLIVSAMNGNSATLALYRYGAREVPLLGGIIGAISHVLLARMTAARTSAVSKPGRDGQKAHADERNRWRLTVALLWVVLIPAGSWLFVHSPALFTWVYGREWAGAADYFRVYLLLLLVRAMPLMVLMQAEGLRGVIVVGSALDLAVAAGGGALLVLIWGCSPMAAAGAYVVGTFLQTGVYLLALWRRCQIVPPWRVFGLSMIVGFGSGIMGLLFMRTLVELFAAVIHAIVVALLVWLLINWVRREEGMTLSENSSDE